MHEKTDNASNVKHDSSLIEDDDLYDLQSDEMMDYNEIRPVVDSHYYDTGLESASQIKKKKKKYDPRLFKIRVYPEFQWIYEGNDVVIQCRDEGILRADVLWKRKDGAPLSDKSTQEFGRLSMSKVKFHESGVFICYVKDFENVENANMEATVVVRKQRRRWGPWG